MASRIGSDLRRARTRREIELPEVEAATRIRARFLSAIENEEWDVLPGGVYTRGFIRTYASYLGLDGDRIAEDYRREVEGEPEVRPEAPVTPAPANGGQTRRRRPGVALLALAAVGLVAAVAIFAIPDGGEEAAGPAPDSTSRPPRGDSSKTTSSAPTKEEATALSMRLVADAEVWVCALDEAGSRLVDGQILQAGAEAGPFRSGSFTVSFGNGEVTMTVDGKRTPIPPTSGPVGYAIDPSGRLTELSEAERPTCE
jgi:cytoskeletal protein RodZ